MAIGDSTRIFTNIAAYNALNALKSVNRKLSLSQLRLATGKRINQVSDDPAGFVISRRLYARTRGLSAAVDNVATAKNVLSVAEGGLSNISDILVQMKEKVTQAASDTMSSAERNAIRNELNEFTEEIDDIVEETTFNDRKLIDGSYRNIRYQTGERPGNTLQVNLSSDSSAQGLGVATSLVASEVRSASGASNALAAIDNAIEDVSGSLQQVGSLISRLGVKENTLQMAITNNQATLSRIEDADMAREALNSTRQLILQRIAAAQLSQANLLPISILNLFR